MREGTDVRNAESWVGQRERVWGARGWAECCFGGGREVGGVREVRRGGSKVLVGKVRKGFLWRIIWA